LATWDNVQLDLNLLRQLFYRDMMDNEPGLSPIVTYTTCKEVTCNHPVASNKKKPGIDILLLQIAVFGALFAFVLCINY